MEDKNDSDGRAFYGNRYVRYELSSFEYGGLDLVLLRSSTNIELSSQKRTAWKHNQRTPKKRREKSKCGLREESERTQKIQKREGNVDDTTVSSDVGPLQQTNSVATACSFKLPFEVKAHWSILFLPMVHGCTLQLFYQMQLLIKHSRSWCLMMFFRMIFSLQLSTPTTALAPKFWGPIFCALIAPVLSRHCQPPCSFTMNQTKEKRQRANNFSSILSVRSSPQSSPGSSRRKVSPFSSGRQPPRSSLSSTTTAVTLAPAPTLSAFDAGRKLKILELGSGTGLVGITAAVTLGACVTVTDLPHVVDNLRFNPDANAAVLEGSGGTVRVAALRWGEAEDAEAIGREFDLVVASDVVYHDQLYEPLLKTLSFLLLGEGRQVFVMAHLRRWKKDSAFFKRARKLFEVEVLHVDRPCQGSRVGVTVYRFTGKTSRKLLNGIA